MLAWNRPAPELDLSAHGTALSESGGRSGFSFSAKGEPPGGRPIYGLNRQPIYLFADSQMLFWRQSGDLFLASVRKRLTRAVPRAAYLGASNGDDPQYYALFEAAMSGIGIHDCRMVLSSFSDADASFVGVADVILLAGGDVEKGLEVFTKVGLLELILKRYREGALLIGISAGAVQLGLSGLVHVKEPVETLKLVPFIIDAHSERDDWRDLRKTIDMLAGSAVGIGIPSGGGLIYYPDATIEALRFPLAEFTMQGSVLHYRLLMPNG